MNVIIKEIPLPGSSLLEHGGHMKSMWVECAGYLMRSRDSLLLRIKNSFNASVPECVFRKGPSDLEG